MRYIPHTEADIARMLRVIGQPSVAALFAHIPEALQLRRPLQIEALDEGTLLGYLGELGAASTPAVGATRREGAALSFLGAGVIPHYIPTAVDLLLLRSEWYTSYTPYQPEISQGTLQAIFEFQTVVAELFGPTPAPGHPAPLIANASMYDGASAAAEAVLMARRVTGKSLTILSGAVHPHYTETTATYLRGLSEQTTLLPVPCGADGRVDGAALEAAIRAHGADLACVLVQTPNYLGVVEDLRAVRAALTAHGPTGGGAPLLVAACAEPLAMGVLAPPAALGADIVCGEGLGLALPPQLGGPGVGLFAVRGDLVRQMPGRLVGETLDQSGRRGYVLTLSTREQHIRRDKATSNICTNHGLVALAMTIHLCLLGRRGFAELAQQNLSRGHYARQRLLALRGFSAAVGGPTFNEFAVRVRGGRAARVAARLQDQGILCGVPLDQVGYALPAAVGLRAPDEVLLVAVTERHRKEDIDRLAQALDEVCP